MIKSVGELKDLLIWAKKEKISAIKIGDIEVHFNNLAFLDNNIEIPKDVKIEDLVDDEKPENPVDIDDDPDLYLSSEG